MTVELRPATCRHRDPSVKGKPRGRCDLPATHDVIVWGTAWGPYCEFHAGLVAQANRPKEKR